jgi:hypothetical protein
MLDILQPQTITSYINEIRKTDPVRNPGIITPVKKQVKTISSKKSESVSLRNLPFEDWKLPPQPEGYIKCSRHDFL